MCVCSREQDYRQYFLCWDPPQILYNSLHPCYNRVMEQTKVLRWHKFLSCLQSNHQCQEANVGCEVALIHRQEQDTKEGRGTENHRLTCPVSESRAQTTAVVSIQEMGTAAALARRCIVICRRSGLDVCQRVCLEIPRDTRLLTLNDAAGAKDGSATVPRDWVSDGCVRWRNLLLR
jgi:hypothetical protein